MSTRHGGTTVVVMLLLALLAPARSTADPKGHVPGELLVRFRAGTSTFQRGALHAATGATVVREFSSVPGLQLVALTSGTPLARAIAQYGASAAVLYAEPNHVRRLQAVPDDPAFVASELWSLDTYPIIADADIDAPEAWDLTTGSHDVVVAVIDTGVDHAHEDLAANMFRNERDCNTNGIDDDGNGFVDDCHGIDVVNGDSDPMDDAGHGTHVAGVVGARGNNGVGVVGVNWRVSLLPCKMLDAFGSGSDATAIACLDYVARMKDRGVNVVATTNSYGGEEFSAALRDAIDAHRQRGILFVAAAGNYTEICGYGCRTDTSNDRKPTYPASYYLPHVLSVANSNLFGMLNSGSALGQRTVHLAAPGTNILSTTPDNTYDYFTGTSMSVPHVVGVAALLKAQDPTRDWKAIKNLILAGTEGELTPVEDALTGKRLNARGAMTCANSTVTSRVRPVPAAVHAVVGLPLELAVLNIRCAAPDGNVTVTVSPGNQVITLRDDGAGADQEAGDGLYTAQWIPTAQGPFSLTFPGADVVPVQVLAGAYDVAPVPFGFRTIGGTELLFPATRPAAITPPFPVRFGGGSFATLFVDMQGAIQFDGNGPDSDQSMINAPLPSPVHSTLIAPFWDALFLTWQNQSFVVWQVTGAAPNRELVVEWRNLGRSDQFCALYEGFVTFQVVFFEGRSDVLFNYSDTAFGHECAAFDHGVSATVGIQVAPGIARMFSYNTASLSDGMSLLWTLAQNGQPAIGVTPASRDFGTVTVGASADLTFVVQNTGTGTLTGEAKTTAPFSIVSGGAYSLTAGQTQTVTVRFSPTTAATVVSDVTFTGGDNPSRIVRGVGAAVNAPPDLPSALAQFRTDGTTAIAAGGWTNQTGVVLKLTMVDASAADTLAPEVEVKPVTTAFTGAGLVAGTPVASTGAPVSGTVTVTGLVNGIQYHWRARTRDAAGQVSGWVSFGANAETARDLGIDTALPTGSVIVGAGSAWTKTRAVALALKCTDTRSGCAQMQLAQDGGAFSAPEPFATTRTWTLTGPDGKKTVAVRYLDGAGNVSKSYTDTITLDTTAPAVTAISATPNPFTLGQSTTIRFRMADALSGSCTATVRILNAAGQTVRTLPKPGLCAAAGTLTSVIWDGRNTARALVPPGTYTIEIIATDQAGNVAAAGHGTVVAQ